METINQNKNQSQKIPAALIFGIIGVIISLILIIWESYSLINSRGMDAFGAMLILAPSLFFLFISLIFGIIGSIKAKNNSTKDRNIFYIAAFFATISLYGIISAVFFGVAALVFRENKENQTLNDKGKKNSRWLFIFPIIIIFLILLFILSYFMSRWLR